MQPMREDEDTRREAFPGPLRRHPVITAVMAVCIVAGAALGAGLLTDDWSVGRRILGGAIGGGGVGILIVGIRMIG